MIYLRRMSSVISYFPLSLLTLIWISHWALGTPTLSAVPTHLETWKIKSENSEQDWRPKSCLSGLEAELTTCWISCLLHKKAWSIDMYKHQWFIWRDPIQPRHIKEIKRPSGAQHSLSWWELGGVMTKLKIRLLTRSISAYEYLVPTHRQPSLTKSYNLKMSRSPRKVCGKETKNKTLIVLSLQGFLSSSVKVIHSVQT